MKTKYIFAILILFISISAQSQILISILLGDKLNSEKIEFGIVGGINRSNFYNVTDAEALNNFNLGFYFHFLLKNNSFLSTGLLVKSNMGATGMASYPIGDTDFDDVFKDATLTTKVSYFNLPILFQQRLWKIVQLEGGVQAGLRTKVFDEFNEDAHDGEVNYKINTQDDYTRLDFGLLGGVGFKLSEKPKSMSIGFNYYYGVVNVSKLPDTKINNSSFYLYMKIPIGLQSKAK